MIEKRYTISELQDLTNTNRRTIHFYSQRGLIPGPDSRGGAATYHEEAYIKLKIIKELQKRRYTLEEIYELFETDINAVQICIITALYDVPTKLFIFKFCILKLFLL